MCDITGCCQLPQGEILLVDYRNKRLKKCGTRYETVDVCELFPSPWDVCYTGNNEAVVSLYKKLQFVDVTGMILTRSVKTERDCKGLVCHNDQLFVTDNETVCIYSTKGVPHRELLNNLNDSRLFHRIAVNNNGSFIYILTEDKVITVNRSGEILSTFTDPELHDARSLCVDNKDHVLVCDWETRRILHISSDGKYKLRTVTDGSLDIGDVRTILFDSRNPAIVCAGFSNKCTVLTLKKR